MKKIISILGVAALMLAAFTFTGCSTTGTTAATHEAIVYYSFADTWTVTKSAYAGYCELAVQGKVSQGDQTDIDAAWEKYRAAFKLSLSTASRDWSAVTPTDVLKLKDDLLTLIKSI